MQAGTGLQFGLNGQQDFLPGLLNVRVIGRRDVVETSQDGIALWDTILSVIPSRCVRKEQHCAATNHGKDDLKDNRYPPGDLVVHLREAIVDPVRQRNTRYQHDGVQGIGRTSIPRIDSGL